jgi:hypothetical protein
MIPKSTMPVTGTVSLVNVIALPYGIREYIIRIFPIRCNLMAGIVFIRIFFVARKKDD